jgi:UDP:flavonoid glycosyltransferase YjiC (YdhE family)
MGTGLLAKGYAARLVSHETFREMANANGLEFAHVEGNPVDMVRGVEGQAWLGSTNNPIRFLYQTFRIAKRVLVSLARDALEACRGSDAIVYSLPLAGAGYSIAERLGVPGIPASLYPLHPTRAFPSIITPTLPFRTGALNWLSGFITAQLFWRIYRSCLDPWRKREVGLPPLPAIAPFKRFEKQGLPYLYGYSPSLIPVPAGWSALRAVCGYWFLDGPADWRPSRTLLDFLAAGDPPVYVGFGSMAGSDGERMTRIVLKALHASGRRAVLSAGYGGLKEENLPEEVLSVGSVPHDWLFARVSAAVHHGGAGTTAAALRAGIPSIIIPFFADQFFWGKRVFESGLGPRPIPRKRLSAEGLAAAIAEAVDGERMRENCRLMAERIAAEDGIARAVDAVHAYLRATARRTMS